MGRVSLPWNKSFPPLYKIPSSLRLLSHPIFLPFFGPLPGFFFFLTTVHVCTMYLDSFLACFILCEWWGERWLEGKKSVLNASKLLFNTTRYCCKMMSERSMQGLHHSDNIYRWWSGQRWEWPINCSHLRWSCLFLLAVVVNVCVVRRLSCLCDRETCVCRSVIVVYIIW